MICNDTLYLQRCLVLAQKALGHTYPNPLVGAVIVHQNQIIGEGWHQKAGQAHAEVNAINAVQNKALLKNACIYVSLEPCAHFGRTPPCAQRIIDEGIPKVVIGSRDPFAQVNGKGIQMLQAAGVDVKLYLLPELTQLNKRFFCFHTQQRPYITLKWAQSADAYIWTMALPMKFIGSAMPKPNAMCTKCVPTNRPFW
jgi:diaminohydroxyphosphoribosylaminopyrimidine deaminase / 5-amino-6-(5-phosphoribosylamino)uracil reductase